MRVFPQWFIDELVDEDDKRKAVTGELKSTSTVNLMCSVHGVYTKEVRDEVNLTTGERKGKCPKCSRMRTTVNFPQWFIDELENDEDREKAIIGSLSSRDRVNMVCSKHGVYTDTVGHLVKRSTGERMRGCPKCKRNIPDWVNNLTKEDIYSKDSRDKIVFICPIHGEYEMRLGDKVILSTGKEKCGCPMCVSGGHQSSMEKEICDLLDKWNVSYSCNERGHITDNGHNYEIDIYISSKRIGIEVNGSYWHASLGNSVSTRKDVNYHFNKFLASEKNGIHLIQIFDVDWIYNRSRIELFLMNQLLEQRRVYARELEIKMISKDKAKEFYDEFHVQGSSRFCTMNLALCTNDTIICCMGFGKQRYGSEEGYYELHRYCVRSGYNVIAGADRLFKNFLNNYLVKEIISYSDNDLFLGTVYPKLGFTFDSYTNPRYYWVNSRYDLRTREQCMLKYLKEEYKDLYNEAYGNKEDYIMTRLGYFKVYRSGNKKWIYSNET